MRPATIAPAFDCLRSRCRWRPTPVGTIASRRSALRNDSPARSDRTCRCPARARIARRPAMAGSRSRNGTRGSRTTSAALLSQPSRWSVIVFSCRGRAVDHRAGDSPLRVGDPATLMTGPCDTGRMISVADQLRRDTADRVGRLSVAERIALALAIGDDDLALYMQASGKNRESALRDLRAQRARGRTPSRSASRE